jgi:Leucine-rich repeat (LRR) protein
MQQRQILEIFMTVSNNFNNSPYRPDLEASSSERKEELTSSQNNVHRYECNNINLLPEDVLKKIFHLSAGYNLPKHGKNLANMRGVCRTWYNLSEDVLQTYWIKLRDNPSFLQNAVIKITKKNPIEKESVPTLESAEALSSAFENTATNIDEKVAKEKFSNESDAALESVESLSSDSGSNEDKRIKQGPHFLRFRHLTQVLRTVTPIPEDFVVLGLQPTQYLRAPFDYALLTIWPKIKQQIKEAPELNRVKQIRQWLKDPENLLKIRKVRDLNLSGLNLSVLPREIGTFTSLKKLILDKNRLTAIPDTICNLTRLKRLELYDNQFKSIPEDKIRKLCEHNKIYSINFSKNPIQFTPTRIDYLILDTDFGRIVYRHPTVDF